MGDLTISRADLLAELSLPADRSAEVEPAAKAAEAWINSHFTEPAGGWGADTQLGALRIAARWYRRRNSLGGFESISAETGPVYVMRSDPDIDRLLGLGPYAAPQVG